MYNIVNKTSKIINPNIEIQSKSKNGNTIFKSISTRQM